MIDFKALAAPFPPDQIEWRIGQSGERDGKLYGMALAYLNARMVMDRLNDECGPENWQKRFSHAADKCVCEIGIRCGDEWVWKADGAGDTDFEADKGALSDAFKRAAVNWGIGRYLYDIESPWVPCARRGKSIIIDKLELPRLRALLGGPPQKTKAEVRKDGDFERICRELRACTTLPQLTALWKKEQPIIMKMPADWRRALTGEKDLCKDVVGKRVAA